jgi:copper chaperone CopZ
MARTPAATFLHLAHPIKVMKETRRLAIDGMTCQNCVRHVKRVLENVGNLNVLDVSIGSALVEFDPAQVSDDQIIHAVREAGYSATARAA